MGTMYGYFLTPLYPFFRGHPVFLAYVHLQFFLVGCELWWLVVGRDALADASVPGSGSCSCSSRCPCDAALGLVVAMATKPLYPAGDTLADTQNGGNFLLGLAEVLIVAVLASMFVEWAREEERKAVTADRQLDAALAAAARAVARSQPPESGYPAPGHMDIEAAILERPPCPVQNLRAESSGIQRSDRERASFHRARRSSPAGSTIVRGVATAATSSYWTKAPAASPASKPAPSEVASSSADDFHRVAGRHRQAPERTPGWRSCRRPLGGAPPFGRRPASADSNRSAPR